MVSLMPYLESGSVIPSRSVDLDDDDHLVGDAHRQVIRHLLIAVNFDRIARYRLVSRVARVLLFPARTPSAGCCTRQFQPVDALVNPLISFIGVLNFCAV